MKKGRILLIIFALSLVLIAARTPGLRKDPAGKTGLDAPGAPLSQASPARRAALPADWSAPENASRTAAFSQTPVAALDGAGHVYVVWEEWFGQLGDRRDVMFATNRSGAWAPPRANTLQYNMIFEVGFPEVAVNESGTDAIYAWMDRDLAREQMVIDWDELAGETWTGPRWISDQVAGSSRRVTAACSPVDGTIGLVWEQDAPSGGVNIIYQYRDGATGRMSAPTFIFPGQDGVQFLPNICFDGRGAAHVVYYSGLAEAAVWYTRNPDPKNLGGWSAPIALSGGTGKDRIFPKVSAADDGDAYVVWTERHSGNEEVYLRFQQGGAWQAPLNLSQTATYSEFPSVAVAPATKDVFVSWSETPDDVSADIMVKTFETDRATGTRSWSPNYQATSIRASEQSCIRVARNGDVHLVYAEGGEIWHIQRLASRLAAVAAPTVLTLFDRVLFIQRKANIVSFEKNPANAEADLREYRLYARRLEDPDDAFAVLTTFTPSAAPRYVHKNLDVGQRYAYLVSVVDKEGREVRSGVTVSD